MDAATLQCVQDLVDSCVQQETAASKVAAGGEKAVAAILHELPRPQAMSINLSITAQGLRDAVAQTRRKAPGPDGWAPTALLSCRAMATWTCAAQGSTGMAPWPHVPAVEGYNGKSRPITVLPLIWKPGAKLLNKALGKMEPLLAPGLRLRRVTVHLEGRGSSTRAARACKPLPRRESAGPRRVL